jgi:ketosteroid isomerase-like protein
MSQEDVDLVVRALEAVARRPRPDFETINQLFHPDHVLVPIEATKLGGSEVEGASGYKRWLESVANITPWEMEVVSAVATGPSTVLVTITLRFRGAASGAELDQATWLVVTVEDGRLRRTETHFDEAEALEAARRGK